MNTPLSLFELNNLVREVIATDLSMEYWVEAELSEVREVRGHCYMELVQKDMFSNTPVAKASAKCWKSKWMYVRPKFEQITGQYLHTGMKVMLKVYADFHEAYGFSWIVTDINPEYTLGDMAKKRMQIIEQLKQEGVFDLQKELEIPMFAQRVAVISSQNAAGFGDFTRQLTDNSYGFKFQVELFPAIMQGEGIEGSVIAALDAINERLDEFDVVVIIRGGGATSDMSGFDTLALAENVANFPLPIITGIGHDRDESVLDMISHTKVKTPTAAAALLVEHLEVVWQMLMEAENELVTVAQHRIENEKQRLSHIAEKIPVLFSLVKTHYENVLDKLLMTISSMINEKVSSEKHNVQLMEEKIKPLVDVRLQKEKHHLMMLEQRVKALDPEILLKRGYSITLCKGKVVVDASMLKSGDEVETKVRKGTFKSIIK
ncbi:MAG: exodeoxyribonuclease VII large subunit [Prevotella sp.]|nr:exodeoxyribonuclease VII large subunit [Prevotella sp.]